MLFACICLCKSLHAPTLYVQGIEWSEGIFMWTQWFSLNEHLIWYVSIHRNLVKSDVHLIHITSNLHKQNYIFSHDWREVSPIINILAKWLVACVRMPAVSLAFYFALDSTLGKKEAYLLVIENSGTAWQFSFYMISEHLMYIQFDSF